MIRSPSRLQAQLSKSRLVFRVRAYHHFQKFRLIIICSHTALESWLLPQWNDTWASTLIQKDEWRIRQQEIQGLTMETLE